MANMQTSSATPAPPFEATATVTPATDRFDQMYGRMKGTMEIVGNIVDRDPDLWNCERD